MYTCKNVYNGTLETHHGPINMLKNKSTDQSICTLARVVSHQLYVMYTCLVHMPRTRRLCEEFRPLVICTSCDVECPEVVGSLRQDRFLLY